MLGWVCDAAKDEKALRALVLLNGELRRGMEESERPEVKAIKRILGTGQW